MTTIPFLVTDAWKAKYPGAVVGALAMKGVTNPPSHPDIDTRKRAVETALRERFAGKTREDLKNIDRIQAYNEYYGAYGKTYHVFLQLESVALKGKPLASVGALVEVMFIAEVDNLLLTAGDDLDAITLPITLDIAKGTESYVMYRGNPQTPKQDDMMISDAEGILSCVLHGPNQRTRIKDTTQNVLYTVYAPKGIGSEAVKKHLEEMRDDVLKISPNATVELFGIYEA